MAEPLHGDGKQDPVTAAVVGRIRGLRHRYGFSAQYVADALTVLDVPMERSVLANLESGRRSFVTVAELCAFAAVLGVSPSHLLGADDHQEETALLVRAIGRRFGIEVGDLRQPGLSTLADDVPVRGRLRRNSVTKKHLREVAGVYRQAVTEGIAPTKAVADHFGASHSTAARWVSMARAPENGFLRPVGRGRSGEDQTEVPDADPA